LPKVPIAPDDEELPMNQSQIAHPAGVGVAAASILALSASLRFAVAAELKFKLSDDMKVPPVVPPELATSA
jgi:hypothetical protein